jgi:hypothetical protein
MTDIEAKALALLNEVADERGNINYFEIYRSEDDTEALCRAIEAHEAFKQEVSDALMANTREIPPHVFGLEKWADLQRFIIPKPKPDPLVDIMEAYGWYGSPTAADNLRAALEARGLEIVEKNA